MPSTTDAPTNDFATFLAMARDWPVDTGVLTGALPLFALVQVLNALLHGGSLLFVGGYAVLVVTCSVVLTQYQIAVYRRQSITGEWR